MTSEFFHIPVMCAEIIEHLDVVKGGLYVDCTLGGGGHTIAILEKGGSVIGIDRDCEAAAHTKKKYKDFSGRLSVNVSKFSNIVTVTGKNIGNVDGVLMDLGVSSNMIDDPSRGFSYKSDGPLLMSMGCNEGTAFEIINRKSARELSRIFRAYGEERKAGRIAAAIQKARASHPIETTATLSEIIEKAVGPRKPQKSKARIFQALRIYVNNELEELRFGLDGALEVLRPGGRLCVISYHSLEGRIVKDFMKKHAYPCVCPHDLPVCRCGRSPDLKLITRKAIKPTDEEIDRNPRSRSALLRVAEKVA